MILFSSVAKRVPGSLFLRNLVERRSLLFQLVRRDFEQRFIGSAMGWIWGLIHPLVMLLSWVFVFQICLKQTMEGVESYPLFLFAGMLPWLLFSETVQRSASSLLDHASLITKTVFPAEIIPVSVFLSALASHLLALALIVVATGVWQNRISIFLVLLPVYMLVNGLLAVGFGWIVAGLNVFQRDTAQVVSVILTFWFWFTPIFITEDRFPHLPLAQYVLRLNPMTYLVRAYRAILINSAFPGAADLGIATLYGLAVFVAGGLFFRHIKRGFADVL